jgi:hypothetical protein
VPRVYMRFEWLAGWRVSFLDGDLVLPSQAAFPNGREADRNGGTWRCNEDFG